MKRHFLAICGVKILCTEVIFKPLSRAGGSQSHLIWGVFQRPTSTPAQRGKKQQWNFICSCNEVCPYFLCTSFLEETENFVKQRSGFRRGERRRLNEAVVWPFPQGACPAAILSLGPHSPAQVRWRKCIPTRAVRAGEWNWLCCSEVDAMAAQHNLNEIGELTGLWRVHHEALPFGVWHYLVSGGFLSGVDIMKLLCSSENGTLPPWSHHVGHPECPRASTGALPHIIFPYGLAFLIYLYVDFVLNWSLEYKGDTALQERMPALYFTKAWVKLSKSDPRHISVSGSATTECFSVHAWRVFSTKTRDSNTWSLFAIYVGFAF